jgi:hypothetical protein
LKIKFRILLPSIIIGGLLTYWTFFSPAVDNITVLIRVILTMILFGGSFCFWVVSFYILLGFFNKEIKWRKLILSILIVVIISYFLLFYPFFDGNPYQWDSLIANYYIIIGGFGFCIFVLYKLFYKIEKKLKKNI